MDDPAECKEAISDFRKAISDAKRDFRNKLEVQCNQTYAGRL